MEDPESPLYDELEHKRLDFAKALIEFVRGPERKPMGSAPEPTPQPGKLAVMKTRSA